MKRRLGFTYRIYDQPIGRKRTSDGRHARHLVIAFDYESRGGVFSPAISLHWRGKNGSTIGYGPKRSLCIPLPVGNWRRWYWRRYQRIVRRLFQAPQEVNRGT